MHNRHPFHETRPTGSSHDRPRPDARPGNLWRLAAASLLATLCIMMMNTTNAAPPDNPVWTDPGDPTLPPDFRYQGEYTGQRADGTKIGAQVIALGEGAFQAVLLPGGLPGAGWDGEQKILLDGRLEGDAVEFQPAEPPKKYLARPPAEFSAVVDFPPPGQQSWSGRLAEGTFNVTTHDGQTFSLNRAQRRSSTMGAEPPADAVVLFDGSDKDEWAGGRVDEKTRTLHTDSKDIRTQRSFGNYMLHLEFLLPFRPEARGQGRSNSGVYQADQYEVQVLDSFGLAGLDNECGGIYKVGRPQVNMCLPPLAWQTYDIDFTNAVVDDNGQLVKPALITVRHNGVTIHENVEIREPTGGGRAELFGKPGPIRLQGHGNPLQYRNIWIIEKDS